ncbi:hypothetical protein, partial [Salmonella sp. SAL4456]|uniref:hypothetical protein n=1 Tax=Salmonella sp. SAL4456 TaxID=3159911 RepID=UPI00397868FF
MKNFTRVLDLERTQRDGKPGASVEVQAHEGAGIAQVADIAGTPAVFRTRSIDVDPAALERARIIPPGADGEY